MRLVRLQMDIARMMIVQARGWAARARREGRSDLGASAIEWAIISAIVVGLALGVMYAVRSVVQDNTDKIEDGSNT
ncbi:hypothetical protein [Solicola gregarius]|uniref:Uncharacterized protein n=1 Tax=Solicola gregarius TaxID=2908642 RepID=A0AA46YKU0_9ACTN|nr:hypothetical protein [Solicola gregarius]UYM04949.1 hypothetical protein L0C25_20880 [Solicola gregarius]